MNAKKEGLKRLVTKDGLKRLLGLAAAVLVAAYIGVWAGYVSCLIVTFITS